MTTRVLIFDAGNPRHEHYRTLLLNAIQARGGKATDPNHKPSKEDRRAEARMIDQIQAISVMDPEKLTQVNKERVRHGMDPISSEAPDDPHAPDPRPGKLALGSWTIVLPQTPDYSLLVSYVESMPWLSDFSRLSVDLEDFLSAAEKVEDGEATPLKAVATRSRSRG